MSEFELLVSSFNYYYLTSKQAFVQYAVIAISFGIYFLTKNKIHALIEVSRNKTSKLAYDAIHRVLTPLLILIFAYGSSLFISYYYPTELLDFFEIILLALVFARIAVYALRYIFVANPFLKTFEKTISLVVWIYALIHLFGFDVFISNRLESILFKVAGTEYNLLFVIKLIFAIIASIFIAMSLVAFVERRIMAIKAVNRNLRTMINKVVKLVIYIVAIIVALDAIGLDITFLSVFGGAFGIGLGFGMQKITSNYISGFTILLDKSLRIGDILTIGEHYGIVTSIKTRYTTLRKLDGVEVIIPNENLIVENIVNHTSSDRKVRVAIDVGISYASSIDLATDIMLTATKSQSRVLNDPEPVVYLESFGDSSINLKLVFYIKDAEEGTLRLKSDISKIFWDQFQKQGIQIPFPQRDLHIISGGMPKT